VTGFGDAEPEDSWHPDDPVPVLVRNLVRRLDEITAHRSMLNWRRLELVADHLAHVHQRLVGRG
jgi:hypothetical protein